MNYLSVCAIVKNEALYIEEWLEYHLLLGVEHFYIWNHESTDNTLEILERYEKLNLVTIKRAYGHKPQLPAYQKCLDRYGKKSKWIAFIDADEFIDCPGDLKDSLKKYEPYAALALNWVFYGSNYEREYQEGLVIERFTRRCIVADLHVKNIVQPHLTKGVGNNAHYFVLKGQPVNAALVPLPQIYYHTQPCSDIFKINHYHTKSKAEYEKRKGGKGREVDGVVRNATEERFKAHDLNHIEEPFSKEFIDKIKKNIEERRKC